MENEIITWLASDNGFIVHIAIFIMLLLGGIGLPIPEDIPILFGGVAAAKHIVHLPNVFITCYLGVVLADQLIYAIGYHFGNKVLSAGTKSRFFPSITEERVNEIREGLRRRRFVYIFIGRHLFPLRTATFITAGALRIRFFDFFIADLVAALISVPIIMAIGHTIGRNLEPQMLTQLAEDLNWYIFGIVLIGIIIYLIRRIRKKKASGSN